MADEESPPYPADIGV
jgi:DDE superfamily endonuclease